VRHLFFECDLVRICEINVANDLG